MSEQVCVSAASERSMWNYTVSHNDRTAQAAKELKAALKEWDEKYGKKVASSRNFEWEAHMDCLMAPPEQPQEQALTREEHPGRLVEVYDYVPSGDKMKKKVIGHAELIPMVHKDFPSKTIFPPDFPTPVVCAEFCDKTTKCHLRQEGIGDLCKNAGRFGKLVHRVDLKWSAWNEFRNMPPKTEFVHSTIRGTVPEIALAHWGSPDAQMNDSDSANGNDEYVSPNEQAREYGDKDEVQFIPAFIFASGKPEWRYMVAFDKQGFPYRKWVKYPSIRPVACRVELHNGYVVPTGRAACSVKITTRADKKRMRAYSAIKKELTQYVSAERAGKMAGQQVAAMATC